MTKKKIRIGYSGYCPPTKYDEEEAIRMINGAMDKIEVDFPYSEYTLVSGGSDVPSLNFAYEAAEARGWNTAAVTSSESNKSGLWQTTEEPVIVGSTWGAEMGVYIFGTQVEGDAHKDGLDALIRVGFGSQSLKEAAIMRILERPTYEYDLPRLED